MSNFTTSPNMSLAIPNVGTDPGPDYANNLNASLTIIDQHNHAAGSGVPINPSGMNINSDLLFNINNATLLRSLRFQPQSSNISLPMDIGCLYESGSGGDLFYNDASGNQIQITKSGGISATSSGISSGSASASFVAGILVVNAATLTPANIQGASLLLGNNVASTNFLTLEPPSAMAASYTLTLPSLPPAQQIMTLDASGNIAAPYTVDNSSIIVNSNVVQVGPQGIQQNMLAPRAIGGSVPAGGLAFSASCGVFNTASTTYVGVTNLAITITTTGRPVMVVIRPDGTGNPSYCGTTASTSGQLKITNVTTGAVGVFNINAQFSSSSLVWPDISVAGAAGTYIYALDAANPSGNFIFINYSVIMAYET